MAQPGFHLFNGQKEHSADRNGRRHRRVESSSLSRPTIKKLVIRRSVTESTKRVALAHFRVGETDGVSLEMAKWKKVLERLGHKAYFCAGTLGVEKGYVIPELSLEYKPSQKIQRNAFGKLRDFSTEGAFLDAISEIAAKIQRKLREFFEKKRIDLFIPNNIWSLPINLPAAIAFTSVVREMQVSTIAHHHDFWWEREYYQPTCEAVKQISAEFMPPKDPLIQHVVINSLAQKALFERRGIESTVVPNVFDFANEGWIIDDYNSDFRSAIRVKPNDIIMLQATRIVDRKGIELAVDLVAELNKPKYLEKLRQTPLYDGRRFRADNRIVLVLAGFVGFAERSSQDYLKRLKEKIRDLDIDARFINEIVGYDRSLTKDGRKGYSLWDTYLFADVVTYPSLLEGWGNQFLEAVRAKLPIVLWEYDVYKADIGAHGFDVVSLGDHIAKRDPRGLVQVQPATIRQAAEQVVTILTDPDRRRAMVEHNFQLGRKFYSLEALEKILKNLLEKC